MLMPLIPDGPDGLTRRGLVGEAANHSDHAFLDRDRAKVYAKPSDRLGKTPGETANDGQFAFLDHDFAKTSDNPPTLGKIRSETAIDGDHAYLGPPSCQNPRQLAIGLGKTPAKTANDGHFALLNPPRAKTPDRLGKTSAGAAIHGHSQEQRRSDWRNSSDWRSNSD